MTDLHSYISGITKDFYPLELLSANRSIRGKKNTLFLTCSVMAY